MQHLPLPVRTFSVALTVAVTLAAAGGCSEVDVTTVDAATIEVAPATASVMVNATAKLTATVLGSGGERLAGRTIEWVSENPNVATVDGNGTVRGVAPGATTIRATSEGANGTASVTVGAGPAIALSATSVGFTARQGGANPAAQNVAITNAGGGTLDGLAVTVGYDDGQPEGWLTATLGGTTAPSSVSLQAVTGSLAPGTYGATVRIAANDAANSPRSIDVSFVIGDAQPAIALSPASLDFEAREGGADPPAQVVQISNAGGGSLSGLTVSLTYPSNQPGGWLTATLDRTTAPAKVTVVARPGSLNPGTYTASIGVASADAANSPQTAGVTFVVTAAPAVLALNPSSVSFATTDVGGNPAAQQVAVTNAGGGSLTGLSASVSYAAGQPTGWLTASLAGTSAPTTLNLAAAKGDLDAGSYSATVRIASSAGTRDVGVTFTIAKTLPPPPGAPGNLTATSNQEGIRIAWNAADGTVDVYVIERKQDVGGTFTVIDSVGAGTLSYQDTGLEAATVYGYRVKACNAGGCSGWSNEATAVTVLVAPGTPTNVTATAVSESEIRLNWAAPGGQTHYEIRSRSRQGSGWSNWSYWTVAGDATSYLHQGLAAETRHQYEIRACAGTLCSAFSNTVTAETEDG